MYQSHFGLKELPFQITPDTDFLYMTRSSRETLNVVMVALSFGEGFIKVTGEVGTGKTLLCRRLLTLLNEKNFVTAYVLNPLLKSEDIYKAFADELGSPPFDESRGFQYFIKQLTEHLVELKRQGKGVVLLVDEAQSLADETLEAIRLMTNLETEKQKILHVVLVGQPELDRRLETQYNLRQLQQRITFSGCLKPMDTQEVQSYINHRLQSAGYQGVGLFTPEAVAQIGRYGGGIPRLINILAHKSLMVAFGKGAEMVDASHVTAAVADTAGLAAVGFGLQLRKWLSRLRWLGSKQPAVPILAVWSACHRVWVGPL